MATASAILWLRRIASFMCLAFGALLVVMWVRSYWHVDHVYNGHADVGSANGTVYIIESPMRAGPLSLSNWKFRSKGATAWKPSFLFALTPKLRIQLPYASLALPVLAAAVIPWLPFRLGLRTLFIAVTALAIILAAMVLFVNNG